MKLVPVADLQVAENRQRREFEGTSLLELSDSIGRLGLLQPLVVRYDKEGKVYLVAGERRLRAIKDMWSLGGHLHYNNCRVKEGLLPTVSLGDLSPIDAFEAELEENIRRTDLTWQEEAEAVASLHKLRLLRNPTHTVVETAIEVHGSSDEGSQDDKVRKQIIVARYLADKEIGAASTVRDAYKLVMRKEEMANNALRAAKIGETYGAHSHKLFLGDCLEWMASMEANSFDCILTDPPYGMGADSFGDGAGRLVAITHEYRDTADSFRALLSAAIPLFCRVAKPAAHLYLCCDIEQFFWLRETLSSAGWSVFRTPLINVKTGSGRVPLPNHGPRRQYEIILYAFRGGRTTTGIQSDVIESVGDENLGHGAQKPIQLFANLLRRTVRPGDSVLDPFCGTGTIFPASHLLRAFATGIEQAPEYYGIAAARMEGLDGP